jgi:hypothetical protein
MIEQVTGKYSGQPRATSNVWHRPKEVANDPPSGFASFQPLTLKISNAMSEADWNRQRSSPLIKHHLPKSWR